MTRKAGRARCGACDRIVYDPNRGSRTPEPHERTALGAMPPSLARGAQLYEVTRRRWNSTEGNVWRDGDGGEFVDLRCPGKSCSSRYRVRDLDVLLAAARGRGEDYVLGWQHRV